jgi:hypothetical protein
MLLSLTNLYSQGYTCGESDPFCTGTVYDFPAGTTGSAEAGPFYSCLSSQPAPAWYYLKIGNPGSITIYMFSTPLVDIDFICWGPFPDPYAPCPYGLTSSTVIDCSYSPNPTEYCDIPNGQTGEYYILLITNYSQQTCNITFSQTSGTGSTDCTILPPPVSNNGPLCVGETLNLLAETVANAAYSWTGPNGFSSTQQNPVIPNVTLANAGDYSCVITVSGQSSSPAITTVVINDLPDAVFLNSSMTVCPGAPAYMVVSLAGVSPFDVTYYNGSNYYTVPGMTGPTDTIFVNPPGPATYSLTQVSDANCTKALSGSTFHVYNYPAATGVLTGNATICEGDTAQLYFSLTGSPPWSITYLTNGFNPQTVVTELNPYILNVSPLVTTQYQFTQLSDAYCNGTASGQALVTIDHPSGMLSGDNTICSGSSTGLIFNLFGFPPWTITYTINGANEQTVTATYSPYIINVAPVESTLYEFTVMNDVFCDGTAEGQAMITVSQPTGVLSGIATVCSGEAAQITFDLTGTPPWNIIYTANGVNPQNVTAYSTPYLVTVTPSVTTHYAFTYFEDNSCQGLPSGSADVTVNPEPVVNAGTDKTIANGTSTTLEGSVNGGSGSYVYQWQPADKLLDPTVVQPVTINLFSSTLFTLTGTDNNGGCFGEDEVLVTITGGVLSCSSSASPSRICQGETSHLQALVSGGSGIYTYAWSSNPPGFSSDLQAPTVSPASTTTYHVVVNDGYNTTQSDVTVNVDELPVPDAGTDVVIPFGTHTLLNGSASGGSGNYSYHWEPASKLLDPDIPQPETINLEETTLFSLTVADSETGCVCGEGDEMAVIINGDALSINPAAQPNTICTGDSTQLFSLAGGGAGSYTYSWTSEPPGFTSSLPDPVVAPWTSTVYYVSVSDGFNFAGGSIGVNVNPLPYIMIGADTIVCVYDTITIDAGNEGCSYIWSNGSTERTITVGSTGIGYDSKTITLTVTSPDGCEATGQRTITFDFVACSGITDPGNNPVLHAFPNPGDGMLNIDFSGEAGRYMLTVTDGLGRDIIKNREILFSDPDRHIVFDISSYPQGIYLLRIEGGNYTPVSFKYILNK